MVEEVRVVVSIINYRTGDLTIASVQSALTALGSRQGDIVVVDNASDDGSAEQIQRWIDETGDPRLRLVRSETNSGFSGGHNQGIAAVPNADWYLILNSDALLRDDFFDVLLREAVADTTSGFFAPQLEWEDGTPQNSCFRFAGPASELMRGAQTGPVTRLFCHRIGTLALPPDDNQIEWASFACILLRGDMVRQIGPMDQGYFLYFEDGAYCLRARRKGWRIRYVPKARAVHFRGGSGPVKKMQVEKRRLPGYYWRSRTRFLRQAHGPLGPLLGNLAWIMGRSIAHLRIFTGRSVPKSHDHEWRDIWLGIFDPLAPDRGPGA